MGRCRWDAAQVQDRWSLACTRCSPMRSLCPCLFIASSNARGSQARPPPFRHNTQHTAHRGEGGKRARRREIGVILLGSGHGVAAWLEGRPPSELGGSVGREAAAEVKTIACGQFHPTAADFGLMQLAEEAVVDGPNGSIVAFDALDPALCPGGNDHRYLKKQPTFRPPTCSSLGSGCRACGKSPHMPSTSPRDPWRAGGRALPASEMGADGPPRGLRAQQWREWKHRRGPCRVTRRAWRAGMR